MATAPMLSLKWNDAQLRGKFREIAAQAPVAAARALNKSLTTARAVMARNISSDVGLKVGVVKEQIRTEAATKDTLTARLTVSGARMPLIDFHARGPEPSRGRGRGVTARLKGGKGRYPHAFIATMRSGHRGVFQRVRRSRLPITELHGPSLPMVFQKHIPAGLEAGHTALAKNLQSELNFELRRIASQR